MGGYKIHSLDGNIKGLNPRLHDFLEHAFCKVSSIRTIFSIFSDFCQLPAQPIQPVVREICANTDILQNGSSNRV